MIFGAKIGKIFKISSFVTSYANVGSKCTLTWQMYFYIVDFQVECVIPNIIGDCMILIYVNISVIF